MSGHHFCYRDNYKSQVCHARCQVIAWQGLISGRDKRQYGKRQHIKWKYVKRYTKQYRYKRSVWISKNHAVSEKQYK